MTRLRVYSTGKEVNTMNELTVIGPDEDDEDEEISKK